MVAIESGFVSLKKYKEELCGDRVEIINEDDSVTMVLADGLGSGVKANILSTLTSKIIGTMMANGMKLEDAVETIAQTLPVCSQRKIAYSTFSILKVEKDGEANLMQFDNPMAIFLHNGKCADYSVKKSEVYGKTIFESKLKLELGDMILLYSDGVVHAGLGRAFNFGWQEENIREFIQDNFDDSMTAKGLASLLTGACGKLYGDMPGDDATVAAVRIRPSRTVNVMIGPPQNPADDEKEVGAFLSSGGMKIVCGGTTSKIVGRYLNEKVTTKIDYVDPNIPPIGYLDGIDLVTEGVLTLSRVAQLLDQYNKNYDAADRSLTGRDGASLLARLLIQQSTKIHFFVGRAINPAHQNPGLPVDLGIKMRLVAELSKSLREAGKKVEIEYY